MVELRIVPMQPAVVLEDEKRYLVVADLHLGFESALGANEIFIGKNTTTKETIADIKRIIGKTRPDALVLLGDVKSSIGSISKNEWDDVPLFFEEINREVETILIPGNHDAGIQRLVPGETTMISAAGMVLGNVLLTHGHTMPSENFSHVDRIVMGHVHPVFFQGDSVVNGQRVWVSIRADKQVIFPSQGGEVEVTVVPSFNKYLYATRRRSYKRSISPIIERVRRASSARIVTLDGSIIGDESAIGSVI